MKLVMLKRTAWSAVLPAMLSACGGGGGGLALVAAIVFAVAVGVATGGVGFVIIPAGHTVQYFLPSLMPGLSIPGDHHTSGDGRYLLFWDRLQEHTVIMDIEHTSGNTRAVVIDYLPERITATVFQKDEEQVLLLTREALLLYNLERREIVRSRAITPDSGGIAIDPDGEYAILSYSAADSLLVDLRDFEDAPDFAPTIETLPAAQRILTFDGSRFLVVDAQHLDLYRRDDQGSTVVANLAHGQSASAQWAYYGKHVLALTPSALDTNGQPLSGSLSVFEIAGDSVTGVITDLPTNAADQIFFDDLRVNGVAHPYALMLGSAANAVARNPFDFDCNENEDDNLIGPEIQQKNYLAALRLETVPTLVLEAEIWNGSPVLHTYSSGNNTLAFIDLCDTHFPNNGTPSQVHLLDVVAWLERQASATPRAITRGAHGITVGPRDSFFTVLYRGAIGVVDADGAGQAMLPVAGNGPIELHTLHGPRGAEILALNPHTQSLVRIDVTSGDSDVAPTGMLLPYSLAVDRLADEAFITDFGYADQSATEWAKAFELDSLSDTAVASFNRTACTEGGETFAYTHKANYRIISSGTGGFGKLLVFSNNTLWDSTRVCDQYANVVLLDYALNNLSDVLDLSPDGLVVQGTGGRNPFVPTQGIFDPADPDTIYIALAALRESVEDFDGEIVRYRHGATPVVETLIEDIVDDAKRTLLDVNAPIDIALTGERLIILNQTVCAEFGPDRATPAKLSIYDLGSAQAHAALEIPGAERCKEPTSIFKVDDETFVLLNDRANGRRIYVVDLDALSITPIELSGRRPGHAALDAQRQLLFVTHMYSDQVSVVDLDQRRQVATLAVGATPRSIARSQVGNTIYVGNTTENTITVIDGATARVSDTIELR